MYKKGIILTLLSVVASLLLIALFSWIIDPYQVFRNHWYQSPTYSPQMRIQAPGLIRAFIVERDDYDTVIIGASLTQNFSPTRVTQALSGEKALQLGLSGGSPREQNHVLEQALKTQKIKKVLIGIHAFYLNNNVDRLGREDFPAYLYSGFPAQYLLSLHTIKQAALLLLQRTNWKKDVDEVVNWTESQKNVFKSFNSNRNLEQLAAQLEKARRKSPAATMEPHTGKFLSIDKYILDVARKNPSVTFYCILPPYSTLNYALMDKKRMHALLSMEQYLIEKSYELKNLRVYCFQDQFQITDNLANYRDLEHFSEQVSNFLLKKLEQGHPTTIQDWLKIKQDIIDHAAQYQIQSHFNEQFSGIPIQ